MKTQHISMIVGPWLAVILALGLVPWGGVRSAAASPPTEPTRAARCGESVRAGSSAKTFTEVRPRAPQSLGALQRVPAAGVLGARRSLLTIDTHVSAGERPHGAMLGNAEEVRLEGSAPLPRVKGGRAGDDSGGGWQAAGNMRQRDTTAAGDANTCPSTPKAVVAAFVEAGFNVASAKELLESDDVRQRTVYYSGCFNPGRDCLTIVRRYRIGEATEDGNEARVKVVYWKIGAVCGMDLKLDKRSTRHEVVYHLENQQGHWKIWAPCDGPHLSVKTTIALLECFLDKDPHPLDRVGQKALKKNIRTLQRLQKGCMSGWGR